MPLSDHLRETRVYDTEELLEEVGDYELIFIDFRVACKNEAFSTCLKS